MNVRGKHQAFEVADHELVDAEIGARYGQFIGYAISAFRTDPTYVVDMAENSAIIAYKRTLWENRMAALKAAEIAVVVPIRRS